VATLEAHVFRHHQNATVASNGGDHRQADAGVAAGGLDQRGASFETT
jgi:hypothetical protein